MLPPSLAGRKCVATFVLRAVSMTSRDSSSRLAIGLCIMTCLPFLIAAMAIFACRWSGVMILTAFTSFSFSNPKSRSGKNKKCLANQQSRNHQLLSFLWMLQDQCQGMMARWQLPNFPKYLCMAGIIEDYRLLHRHYTEMKVQYLHQLKYRM